LLALSRLEREIDGATYSFFHSLQGEILLLTQIEREKEEKRREREEKRKNLLDFATQKDEIIELIERLKEVREKTV
jgi:hypothetical protein